MRASTLPLTRDAIEEINQKVVDFLQDTTTRNPETFDKIYNHIRQHHWRDSWREDQVSKTITNSLKNLGTFGRNTSSSEVQYYLKGTREERIQQQKDEELRKEEERALQKRKDEEVAEQRIRAWKLQRQKAEEAAEQRLRARELQKQKDEEAAEQMRERYRRAVEARWLADIESFEEQLDQIEMLFTQIEQQVPGAVEKRRQNEIDQRYGKIEFIKAQLHEIETQGITAQFRGMSDRTILDLITIEELRMLQLVLCKHTIMTLITS